jgi:hypothetical protein
MYRLSTIRPAILVAIILTFMVIFVERDKGSTPADPCFLAGERRIRVIYLVRGPSKSAIKPKECALCDADNAAQWNALYRVFGGREDIEFMIVRPKGAEAFRDGALRHDLSIAGNGAGPEDKIVVCDRGVKRLDHTGVIDMVFIREVYATLANPQDDGLRLF